ncbi:MAG: hypothetical protein U0641_09170 [Anaerolineae bacterium]
MCVKLIVVGYLAGRAVFPPDPQWRGEDAITFDRLPPGWTRVYAYPGRPCAYCVVRITP